MIFHAKFGKYEKFHKNPLQTWKKCGPQICPLLVKIGKIGALYFHEFATDSYETLYIYFIWHDRWICYGINFFGLFGKIVGNSVSLLFSFITGKVIPNDRVHPRLWKGSNRKFRFIPRQKNEIKKQNKVSAIVQTNRTAIPSKVSSLMIKKSTKAEKC